MKELSIVLMILGGALLASPLWLVATHYTIGQDALFWWIQGFAGASLFSALAAWILSCEIEKRAKRVEERRG